MQHFKFVDIKSEVLLDRSGNDSVRVQMMDPNLQYSKIQNQMCTNPVELCMQQALTDLKNYMLSAESFNEKWVWGSISAVQTQCKRQKWIFSLHFLRDIFYWRRGFCKIVFVINSNGGVVTGRSIRMKISTWHIGWRTKMRHSWEEDSKQSFSKDALPKQEDVSSFSFHCVRASIVKFPRTIVIMVNFLHLLCCSLHQFIKLGLHADSARSFL